MNSKYIFLLKPGNIKRILEQKYFVQKYFKPTYFNFEIFIKLVCFAK